MLFNSIAFLVFLPIVFGLYWLAPKKASWQNGVLLAASFFFYGWWDWRFLFLIVASVLWTYVLALKVEKGSRLWLVLGIIGLTGVLGFFKYYNFFIESIRSVFPVLHYQLSTLKLILPLGISFYTFMSIGYLLDVYWRKVPAERNLATCAAFLMFFPQIAAGPIGRAQLLLPQYKRQRSFDSDKAIHGLSLICYGFFKKIVVADTLAIYVNKVWIAPEIYPGVVLAIAAVFYSIEIYCDFSGYSDIARGVAKLFNIDLMLNFDRPYLSKSFGEFWKRWHISLSSWFKDYLYIPLGGNRVPIIRNILNLWIVMLVSGLWHGAAWGFVLWGAIYALYMTIGRFTRRLTSRLPAWINILALNLGVTFAWIFFRGGALAPSFAYVKRLLAGGFSFSLMQLCGGEGPVYFATAIMLCLLLLLSYLMPRDCRFATKCGHFLFSSSCLFIIVFFGMTAESAFIYFRF